MAHIHINVYQISSSSEPGICKTAFYSRVDGQDVNDPSLDGVVELPFDTPAADLRDAILTMAKAQADIAGFPVGETDKITTYGFPQDA